jgi:hypothetical protein
MNHNLVSNTSLSISYIRPVPLELIPKGLKKDPDLSNEVIIKNQSNYANILFVLKNKSDTVVLGGINISTVSYNCGAIHISNLVSYYEGTGIGSYILNEVLRWLRKQAGYSLIFGNTAGDQNEFVPTFWKKNGFSQMMPENYINLRSENINIWIYKLLDSVETVPLLSLKKEVKK